MSRQLWLRVLLVITGILFWMSSDLMASKYFDQLKEGAAIHGFVVQNVYLNGKDEPFGGRFLHRGTGFLIDLFEIQSVPQGFFWVNTPITTDMGQPHTCEHLLLGKGAKARRVSSLEEMSLVQSTAYTSQLYTCYSFGSEGGNEAFFELFKDKLDALLHPDFSDEEIRREVCHIGVVTNPRDGSLHLEEKGTVYTEMVSSTESFWHHLFGAMNKLLYGEGHPLSTNSGGEPSAIRRMHPSDLWQFQKEKYQLNNMGIIAAIPQDITSDEFLRKADLILKQVDNSNSHGQAVSRVSDTLPQPHSDAPYGTIKVVDYPSASEQDPGNMVFAWPPTLTCDGREKMMLDVFMYCVGGSQTSNLYDKFINSSTRVIDLGASGIWAGADDDIGHSIMVFISDVRPQHVTDSELTAVSNLIQAEIAAIASYPADSPQLAEFNNRAKTYLAEQRRSYANYLNSPPGFGLRDGSGGGWYYLIKKLEKIEGFRKSLLLKNEMDYVLSELSKDVNVWTPLIAKWKLLDVKPYAVGCIANPAMITQAVEEKGKRLKAFTDSLKNSYATASDSEAIARYKTEFDRQTAIMDAEAAQTQTFKFMDKPPLSYDPQLDYTLSTVNGKIPMLTATFNSMTSSTVGIAFNMRVIPEDKLLYAGLLPLLVNQVGVVDKGQIIDFPTMSQRLQNEILNLKANIIANPSKGRVELFVSGAGNNPEETKHALEWMKLGLLYPYLQESNLSRVRDIVNSTLSDVRNTMRGSEEYWVNIPANAYLYQSDKLYLAGKCFLTQEHFLRRLKWRLMGVSTETVRQEVEHLFDLLAEESEGKNKQQLIDYTNANTANFTSDSLTVVYNSTSTESQKFIKEALSELALLLPNIPEENISSDWQYLCRQMKGDLLYGPQQTLHDIQQIITLLYRQSNARMFLVANQDDQDSLKSSVADFVSSLDDAEKLPLQQYDQRPFILERMRSRYAGLEKPTYVGLVNENTRNGVLIFSAGIINIEKFNEENLLDVLAASSYAGTGAHTMYMKTWSAGLAYSNGLRVNELSGRLGYYAERCPDIALTMRFVVDQLKKAPYDPTLREYAVAQVFNASRSSLDYVDRTTGMADNLADGNTPEVVANYRQAILDLRQKKNLYDLIYNRKEKVYGRVLIGYGEDLSKYADGNYFIVGPPAQFEKLDEYIGSTGGIQTTYRLYPRDFWITD